MSKLLAVGLIMGALAITGVKSPQMGGWDKSDKGYVEIEEKEDFANSFEKYREPSGKADKNIILTIGAAREKALHGDRRNTK